MCQITDFLYSRVCGVVQVSRSVCVMTTQLITKLLRSKEASAAVDFRTWPPVLDTGTDTHRLWSTVQR